MAYNKNTNWDNEKKYLDNLSKNGNAGEKAWAESQKKVLASAQAQYGGSSSGGTTSGGTSGGTNKNSQYTGSSNGVKVNNSLQQAYKDEMNANSKAWYNADEAEKARLHARNQDLAKKLGGSVYDSYNPVTGTWGGEAGGITSEDIANWEDNYNQENERPTTPKQDPRIQEYLDKYLNRDEFSYDVMNDPLYQQYADIYRREGDRAMRETMAEAAASAGGMNTYAMTAAMQANNYYNSQLNDKVPELYQAAYDKYLKNIDLQLQDLGVLQDMDDTQYARYRDTMQDWKDDKNFAYGVYKDAVQQNNWETNFDNNNYWANKNFDNENFWANKNFDWKDSWKNTEWDADRGDIEYERNQTEQEKAYNKIIDYISMGVTSFSDDELAKAGIDRTKLNQMITQYQLEQAAQVKSSGGGGGNKTGGNDKKKTSDDNNDDGWIPKKTDDDSSGSVPVIDEGDGSANGLGIGPVSYDLLEELALVGAIVGDENGNMYWANGWNNSNYRERLNSFKGYGNLLTLPGLKF